MLNFNTYLTGLIEGDGSIIISENNKVTPCINLAFNIKDEPLAKKIISVLGYGNLNYPKGVKLCLIKIYQQDAVYDMIKRMNGNMRTPKIRRLNLLIDKFNSYNKYEFLNKKTINTNNFSEDSWLAGMTDADGNFNILLQKRKNGKNRLILHYRMEVSQKNFYGEENFNWCSDLSLFLSTSLYTRVRERDKKYYSYIVMTFTQNSNKLIIDYLDKHPLLSSKRLDYEDWKELNKSREVDIEKINYIKSQFNNKRKAFSWEHLNVLN